MKKRISSLLILLAFAKGNAQILDPVKWTTKIEKKSATNYILTFNGIIEDNWHMYSQFTPEGGPLPLEVIFKNQKGNFNLVGKAKEGKTTTAYNDVFEVNETFFGKNAQNQQQITILNPKIAKVEVDLNYQVCKESCINLEKKFSFTLPAIVKTEVETIAIDTAKNVAATSKPEMTTADVEPVSIAKETP